LSSAAASAQESLAQTLAVSGPGSSGAETSVQEPELTSQMPGAASEAAPAPSAAAEGY
jgi:hypothetical protein